MLSQNHYNYTVYDTSVKYCAKFAFSAGYYEPEFNIEINPISDHVHLYYCHYLFCKSKAYVLHTLVEFVFILRQSKL